MKRTVKKRTIAENKQLTEDNKALRHAVELASEVINGQDATIREMESNNRHSLNSIRELQRQLLDLTKVSESRRRNVILLSEANNRLNAEVIKLRILTMGVENADQDNDDVHAERNDRPTDRAGGSSRSGCDRMASGD